jgi:hypothetical protein
MIHTNVGHEVRRASCERDLYLTVQLICDLGRKFWLQKAKLYAAPRLMYDKYAPAAQDSAGHGCGSDAASRRHALGA